MAGWIAKVGVRTVNPHQRSQAERFGVEIAEMSSFVPDMSFDFRDPLAITAMVAAKFLKEIAACMLRSDQFER